jgi:hypothetical protein
MAGREVLAGLATKGGKAMQRELEKTRLYQEALRRIEEMLAPYEGAMPKVEQRVFPRVTPGPKMESDAAIQAAIGDKGVMDKMLAGMERGRPLMNWYNMEPLRLLWNDISGPEIGTQRFNRMQDYMGSTSPVSDVDLNVGNATRWNSYDINQTPPAESLTTIANPKKPGKFKEKLDPKPPTGYGSTGQIPQYKMSMPLLSGEISELDPLKHLKTSRYTGDLKGNWANLPVDRHGVRAPLMLYGDPAGLSTSVKLSEDTPSFNAQERFAEMLRNNEVTSPADVPVTWWKDAPKNARDYYLMEDYYKMLSDQMGVQPGQGQPMAWVGHAGLTGVESDPSMTAMQLFNRRAANQSVKRNIDPRDLLTQVLTGRSHLGLAGAGLVGSQFLPGGENRQ